MRGQPPWQAYIGLGSNLHNPEEQILNAVSGISRLAGIELLQRSSLYHSKPWGVSGQPDFVNAVVSVTTLLDPQILLNQLLLLEDHLGRVREKRWGPRTIDLDLLLVEQLQVQTAQLTLPHPYMHVRDFVLAPLLELAPQITIPGKGAAVQFWQPFEAAHSLHKID